MLTRMLSTSEISTLKDIIAVIQAIILHGLNISQEGRITEEKVGNLENAEMSKEEFENYVYVDANVITS